jgi:radical SAM protein with 4Fe4S-binding SPASM domain
LRRETLYEVLKKAKEFGIEKVFVETNGTLISDEDLNLFKKYGIDISVSLDGAVKETNDYIRGKGSYEKTINAIKKLTNSGVQTRIGMTLMKPNIKEVDKIVYLAKDLGVNSISFNLIFDVGRTKIHKNLLLNFEEAHLAVLAAWRKAKELGIETNFEGQFKILEELEKRDACNAGKEILSVSSDGNVYPCNMFLGIGQFNAGNLRERRLENIWRKSAALKKLRHVSVLEIEGCKDCEMKFKVLVERVARVSPKHPICGFLHSAVLI